MEEMKEGGDEELPLPLPVTKVGRELDLGRTDLASSRQERMERFVFAFSRKMRPRRILRHPIEKRKKAETRVKSSVCWERTVAPMRHWKIPKAPRPNEGPRTGK